MDYDKAKFALISSIAPWPNLIEADSEFRFKSRYDTYYFIQVNDDGEVIRADVWDDNLKAFVNCTRALQGNSEKCAKVADQYWEQVEAYRESLLDVEAEAWCDCRREEGA